MMVLPSRSSNRFTGLSAWSISTDGSFWKMAAMWMSGRPWLIARSVLVLSDSPMSAWSGRDLLHHEGVRPALVRTTSRPASLK
jgi:hypothetical protein